jgi:hypothetical protein
MTAIAPPASGGVPTWPTTPPHAERSAVGSHAAAARPGRRGCRTPVGVEAGGSSAPPPRGCAHRWNVVDHGRQHGHVSDVGGGDRGGQRQPTAVAGQQARWSLVPGLPRSTGFAPTWSPPAWRARSWCPRWPATSPAGPAPPADPGPRGGAVEHAGLRPLGQAPAGRRRAAAKLPGREQPPWGGGAGHEHDRGEAGPVGDGTATAAVGRPWRNRQQRLDQCPQLVRHKVISEGCHRPDPGKPIPGSETTS